MRTARETHSSASRRDLAVVTLAWIASRAGLVLVAWAVLLAFPPESGGKFWHAFPDQPWLDGWARFDSAWYREIYEQGYHFDAETGRGTVNFFPLYAGLVGVLSLPLRALSFLNLNDEQAFFVAGMIVPQLASWLGLVGLHGLVRERIGRPTADRAVWLLCLFPFSFYLGAVYAEGLYLALAIWAFRLATQERWGWACVLASLAAVTRIPGFLVAALLALEYLRRHGPDPRTWGREVLAFLVTPIPLLCLLAAFGVWFGEPFIFRKSQSLWWGRTPSLHHVPEAVEVLRSGELSAAGRSVVIWRLGLTAAIVPAVGLAWHRLGAPLGAYTLATLALPAVSGIVGMGRYWLVAFPAFAVLGALVRGRVAWTAVLLLFVPFLVYFTAQFALWGPMAGPLS